MSTDQAAHSLGLSSKTVHTHRKHIMDKLGLVSSSQLVVHAASWGKHRSPVVSPQIEEPSERREAPAG